MAAAHHRKTRFATLRVIFGLLMIWVGAPQAAQPQNRIDDGIRIGQPKIWRYERIYPLLDGMLRDIESTSLQSMSPMNPNEANLQYIDFLRSLVDLQVDYNQGIGISNQQQLARLKSQQTQQQLDDTYLTDLKQQRIVVSDELTQAEKAEFSSEQKANLLDPSSVEGKAAQEQETQQKASVSDLQSRLKDLSTQISQVNSASSNPQAFTNADTVDTSKSNSTQPPQFLDQVPDDVKKALLGKIGTADLPASKQLENYLTLLNERLSKQLSVIEDDASRNGYELYLMQFDVGLYGFRQTKDQIARVEFSFGNSECSSEATAYAYSLIPGASAYNIQEYIGKSEHVGIIGAFNLLMGLGANGSYQRQRDQLHNGLVQSVYESGFSNGVCSFGWYYGPSPFENFVSPGIRSTYALVAVRRDANMAQLSLTANAGWENAKGVIHNADTVSRSVYNIKLPKLEDTPRRSSIAKLSIKRLAYQTEILSEQKGATGVPTPAKTPAPTNTVLIVLDEPADPDLMVTVAGTLLKRTRDTRGQAIRPKNQSDATAAPPPRGEFEVDGFGPNSWILANPTTLLLQISQDVSGYEFPVIRLTDASSPGEEVLNLLDANAEIDVNNFRFLERPPTRSAFAPLFSPATQPIDDYLKVSVDERTGPSSGDPNRVSKIRIGYHPLEASQFQRLNDRAEVVLDATLNTAEPHQWPLKCIARDTDLICDVPTDACETADIACGIFPGDARLYMRGRLQPYVLGETPSVSSPIDVEGSAVFESSDVLPYVDLESSRYGVQFENGAWVIRIQGTHIKLVNPAIDTISEFGQCLFSRNTRGSVSLAAASDSVLAISVPPSSVRDLCSSDIYSKYHLLHVVGQIRPSTPTFESQERPSVSIEIPNLLWAIEDQFISLNLSDNGDGYYSVSGPLLPSAAVRSVRLNDQYTTQSEFVSTNILRFKIPAEAKKSSAVFTFKFGVGNPIVYFESQGTDNLPFCFNVAKGNTSGCPGVSAAKAVPTVPVSPAATKTASAPAKSEPAATSTGPVQHQPATPSSGQSQTKPLTSGSSAETLQQKKGSVVPSEKKAQVPAKAPAVTKPKSPSKPNGK